MLSYGDFRAFDNKLDKLLEQQAKILHNQRLTHLQGILMDARLQEVLDKQAEIKAETGQYIADRDARDAALEASIAAKDATIADLTAQLAAGAITIAEFQAGLDAAKTAADEAADLLPPVRVPPVIEVPPVEPPVVDPAPVDPAPVADPVVDPNA